MTGDGPTLWVVCGVPGVGKTSVATYLAERVDAELLRTDVVRKELIDEPQYTDAEFDRVYRTILERGRTTLQDGRSVVFDGTYRSRTRRESVADLAADVGVPCRFLKVECDSAVVETRIENRNDVSDAEFEEHLMIKERFEPLECDHATVDNAGTKAETQSQVDALIETGEVTCGPDGQ